MRLHDIKMELRALKVAIERGTSNDQQTIAKIVEVVSMVDEYELQESEDEERR